MVRTCTGIVYGDGSPGVQGQSPATAYKDYVDSSLEAPTSDLKGRPWPKCAKFVLLGNCTTDPNHEIARVVLCGKEWCEHCGEDDSWIHKRRIARIIPKVWQIEKMGALIIQPSLGQRHLLRTKVALQDFGRLAKMALVRYGIPRAIRRWHHFGDDGSRHNPHLEVLYDGGFMRKKQLRQLREYLCLVFDDPKLVVHYRYRQSAAEKMHTVRYHTRSTFRKQGWDYELARNLHGFQNQQSWGRWKSPPVWGFTPQDAEGISPGLVKAHAGKCPVDGCSGDIKWQGKAVFIAWLDIWLAAGFFEEIGGGYYASVDTRGPPGDDDPEDDPLQGLQRIIAVRERCQNSGHLAPPGDG